MTASRTSSTLRRCLTSQALPVSPLDAHQIPALVLLLGWLGCRPKDVAKYDALYRQELDSSTKVVTMRPGLLQTASPAVAQRAAEAYMAEVADAHASLPDAPVVAHVMSNAGWLAFGSLLHLGYSQAAAPRRARSPVLLEDFRAGVLQRISGMVIDSAPSRPTPDIWARGFVAAALGEPAAGIEQQHPFAVQTARHVAQQYLTLPDVTQHMQQVSSAWATHAPLSPQLYLYSSADGLIPSDHVETFMAQQAQRGVDVSSHRWDDSAHCEHLRVHPQQYRQLVSSFVQRCVAQGGAAPGGTSSVAH